MCFHDELCKVYTYITVGAFIISMMLNDDTVSTRSDNINAGMAFQRNNAMRWS